MAGELRSIWRRRGARRPSHPGGAGGPGRDNSSKKRENSGAPLWRASCNQLGGGTRAAQFRRAEGRAHRRPPYRWPHHRTLATSPGARVKLECAHVYGDRK
jgi:hypothetical protein